MITFISRDDEIVYTIDSKNFENIENLAANFIDHLQNILSAFYGCPFVEVEALPINNYYPKDFLLIVKMWDFKIKYFCYFSKVKKEDIEEEFKNNYSELLLFYADHAYTKIYGKKFPLKIQALDALKSYFKSKGEQVIKNSTLEVNDLNECAGYCLVKKYCTLNKKFINTYYFFKYANSELKELQELDSPPNNIEIKNHKEFLKSPFISEKGNENGKL